MARPLLRVAEVVRQYGDVYRARAGAALSTAHLRVMAAVEQCRTAALGGHVEACDRCGHRRVWYNSCHNRHCPSCQSLARARWVDARTAELLDCEYFHVVFTVPQVVAAIALHNPAVVYGILFRATAETLRTIAADPKHLGAEIGFIAVLHTWDQTLGLHPHLHCVVPGGGLSPDGTRWVACRPGFFLPVRVLSRLFRRLFLRYLEEAFDTGQLRFGGALSALTERRTFVAHLAPARKTEWVVYAKPPFGGPQQVLDYVGRYTHRVAISDDRLLDVEAGHVRFRYRNSRTECPSVATATLSAPEFIRRFLLHVLPTGFHRIRYYGLFGNRHRTAKLARCRQLLGMVPPRPVAAAPDYRDHHEALTEESLRVCPICGDGHMKMIETVSRAYPRPAIIDTSRHDRPLAPRRCAPHLTGLVCLGCPSHGASTALVSSKPLTSLVATVRTRASAPAGPKPRDHLARSVDSHGDSIPIAPTGQRLSSIHLSLTGTASTVPLLSHPWAPCRRPKNALQSTSAETSDPLRPKYAVVRVIFA